MIVAKKSNDLVELFDAIDKTLSGRFGRDC